MKIACAFSLLALISCDGPYREPLPRCSVSPGINEWGTQGIYGITCYIDIDKAKNCAASTGRKILVMFTAYSGMAVPGMDWEILRRANVRKLIDGQFVLLVLYVDDKTLIEVTDSVEVGDSTYAINTIGKSNAVLQAELFTTNSQPFYVVVDASMNPLAPGFGYVKDDSIAFEEMLQSALRKADSLK